MTGPLVAGVELGGTKCVALVGHGPGAVLARATVATGEPGATLAALAAALRGWAAELPVAAVGIASFGPLELDPAAAGYGRMLATPKPGWSGVDVLGALRLPGLPAAIDTDVVGAALAEGRWGAAQRLAAHAYVTVGTGVGVGVIAGGRPLTGAMHGELGHMRVPRAPGDGFPGVCPWHGDCVEGLVCGPALAARFGPPGSVADSHPGWADVAHALAAMLHNLLVTAAPARVAIGGGVIAGRPGLIDLTRAALAASLNGYGPAALAGPDWLGPPGLGADAGPLGALAVALAALGA